MSIFIFAQLLTIWWGCCHVTMKQSFVFIYVSWFCSHFLTVTNSVSFVWGHFVVGEKVNVSAYPVPCFSWSPQTPSTWPSGSISFAVLPSFPELRKNKMFMTSKEAQSILWDSLRICRQCCYRCLVVSIGSDCQVPSSPTGPLTESVHMWECVCKLSQHLSAPSLGHMASCLQFAQRRLTNVFSSPHLCVYAHLLR